MSVQPLAEVYEKLKELRRQGELPKRGFEDGTIQQRTESQLHGMYGVSKVTNEDDIAEWYAHLIHAAAVDASRQSGSLVRILEIRTLADRIFGDEKKAEAWLNRKNPSFSGQKPIDLLNDELGAAVVREALEQIDHGLFA
jgi:antitoxin Xre/MbcA/ParS-like protein